VKPLVILSSAFAIITALMLMNTQAFAQNPVIPPIPNHHPIIYNVFVTVNCNNGQQIKKAFTGISFVNSVVVDCGSSGGGGGGGGTQGPPGPPGPPGVQGPIGLTGPQGKPGQNATICVVTAVENCGIIHPIGPLHLMIPSH
jgi:hypothetical protein